LNTNGVCEFILFLFWPIHGFLLRLSHAKKYLYTNIALLLFINS
jgi:hypothetical protein